jgi:hypothetical protein
MRLICLGALLLIGLAGCKKEEQPSYPTATPAPVAPVPQGAAPGAAPAAPAQPGAPAPGDNSIPAQDFRDGKG